MSFSFRNYIVQNFNIVLIVSLLLGLFLPYVDALPSTLVIVFLAIIIFFSCAKITVQDVRDIKAKEVVYFYVLRFIVFPLLGYAAALTLIPDFAVAILLFLLMPVGVSAPAFTAALGGNTAITLVILIVSSLLTPFMVPTIFATVVDTEISIDIQAIFVTLLLAVLVPIFCYSAIAKKKPATTVWIKDNSSFVSVSLISLAMVLVIAKNRDLFLQDTWLVLMSLLILCLVFFAMYCVGYFSFFVSKSESKRIGYGLSSGVNNNVLGISLALLFFPPEVTVFMVVSELPWALSVPLFNHFVKRQKL